MNKLEAIALIHEMVAAEVEATKAANTGRGLTKKAEKRERQAAQELFVALTGLHASSEELTEIVSY